jgi:ubiquinone biosynthesis protein
VDLLAALSRRNERGILEVLLEWTGSEAVDESQLHADIGEFLFQYDQVQLKDLNLSMLINDVMALMRDHSIMLPSDLSMLFKALITLEGFARQINPSFQMVEHLTPFVRKIILDRYTPSTLLEKGGRTVMELLGMVGGLPRDLSRLSKEIRRGKFRIDIDVKRLDHFGQQLDKSANRLTLGIVTGCLIIGSSIVMTVKAGPMLFGLPLLGFLGFVVAFFNSLWLMASIWRSGKDL